ncbi:conserved Crenarchaeal protein [Sulfolobus acidocaldarius DSM 639]|uniref:Conserved Crenarchaeal protein n=1 Tax=Sulfolobus acidocaldarius (strain ATCC 33909 / DSM 639 / JCM 8929 / NBRC 15157 / NCIMB 11770) TaxID=330779 RepID=Q4J6E3_SULAC|nr:conserved Crenarchaeal protein [Sulfolobus acidocaldarius DSM 639]
MSSLGLSYNVPKFSFEYDNLMLVETAAEVYLREGDEFLGLGDLVQASEKYYKAAEEAIKLLAIKHQIPVLKDLRKIDRWRADLLFLAVKQLSLYYKDLSDIWKSAWILHVEGFHETRLNRHELLFYVNHVKKLSRIIATD